MITSGFLVFILLFLTASLVVTVIAAWRRAWFNPELALSFVTIGLFLWLWLGTDLPHSLTLLKWSAGGGELIWSLQVDPQSWRSAVYLFLLTIATLLVARPQFKPGDQNQKNSPSQWLALPILLLLMFTGLVAVLADSIAGLASSWTLLTVIWFVFTWTSGQPVTQVRRAMTSGGALLAGVGFLWLAQATLPSSIGRLSPGENWSEPAIVFASLAAMVFLGAIPFHWWRSIEQNSKLPAPESALVQLVPVIVGGSLLARIASYEVSNTGYLLFMTGFGLIGLLIGISQAWIHLGQPRDSLAGFILAEAGVVMLVGVWAGPTAVVAQVGVFTLATAAFYLVSEKSLEPFNWPVIVPVAAVAGLPLTLGFSGLTGLYDSWLDRDLFTLLLVAVFLSVPLTSVALLVCRNGDTIVSGEPYDRFQPVLDKSAIALLSLGLLTLPDFRQASNDLLILLLLLIAGAAGIALAWFIGRKQMAQLDLKDAFRLNLPRNPMRKLFKELAGVINLVVRQGVTILEGEGGMIWVVVLIIVMWLARRY